MSYVCHQIYLTLGFHFIVLTTCLKILGKFFKGLSLGSCCVEDFICYCCYYFKMWWKFSGVEYSWGEVFTGLHCHKAYFIPNPSCLGCLKMKRFTPLWLSIIVLYLTVAPPLHWPKVKLSKTVSQTVRISCHILNLVSTYMKSLTHTLPFLLYDLYICIRNSLCCL